MNFPPILYKYRSVADALRILCDRRVKISSARAFNDPFELSPIFVGQIEQTNFLALILKPESLHALYRQRRPPMSFSEHAAFMHASGEALFALFDQHGTMAFVKNTFEEDVANNFPMFCLSEPNDDLLMWSHYADCHEGIVLGFSTEGWGPNPRAFLPVRYRDKRPEINLNDILSTSDRCFSVYTAAYTTKSKHWEYEGEFRCFFGSDPRITSEVAKDGSEMREIIFGCRCTRENRSVIASAATTAGCTDVRYRHAVLDPTHFAMRIEDLENVCRPSES
jgi:hypothetical protein